jgi:uncharacterized protein YkuJ
MHEGTRIKSFEGARTKYEVPYYVGYSPRYGSEAFARSMSEHDRQRIFERAPEPVRAVRYFNDPESALAFAQGIAAPQQVESHDRIVGLLRHDIRHRHTHHARTR